MATLFWIGIVLHVILCVFLILLVLVQNDKMGGLAGLGGMTTQSAFSTAGAATFIQKLTKIVAIIFFVLVLALGILVTKMNNTEVVSDLQRSAVGSAPASEAVVPELPTTFDAPAPAEAPVPAPAE